MTPKACPKHGGQFHADGERCPAPSETNVDDLCERLTADCPTCHGIGTLASQTDTGWPGDPCETCGDTGTLSGECSEGDGTEWGALVWREEPCPDCGL